MGPTILDGLLGYQRQQEALIQDKQRVQDNALSLQQKMYGIRQQSAENEAIKQFDPANIDSLQQVAGTLAQAGDAKGALGVLDEYQNIKDKQSLAQTHIMNQKSEQFKIAGGILSGMDKTPEAYQAGLMTLLSNGISPTQFGLTGNYDNDRSKLPQLSQSTMTAYQKAEMQERTRANDRLIENDTNRLTQEKTRNSFEERRVTAEESRLEETQKATIEKSKMDILSQNKATNAINLKKQAMAVPKKQMVQDAQDLLAVDPRVAEAPATMQKVLALRAASKAAQAMAAKIDPKDPNTDFDPEDYSDEVKRQFDMMVEKKEWSPYSKHRFGKDEGGFAKQIADTNKQASQQKQAAPPPPKTVDPKTLKPGDYIPTPSGKKYKIVGKKPDGTPMVETDANGKPVAY